MGLRARAGPICVLGMGRSGTSLATGVLGALGADLGPTDTMYPPAEHDNATGYWEQNAIMELNDAILASFDGTWDKPPGLPRGWEHAAAATPFKARARQIVEDTFPADRLWAWKDPRTCFTLPLWREVLEPVAYVICVRDPIEVAASLTTRDQLRHPPGESIDLWLRYNCAALRNTGGGRRVFVFYEDWFPDPRLQVERLSRLLGIDKPSPAAMSRVDALFADDLRHHRASLAGLVASEDIPAEVPTMYLLLRQFGGTQSEAVAGSDIASAERFAESLWDRLVRRRRAAEALATELAACHVELERHRDALESIRQSRSWRLTRPLRTARQRIPRRRQTARS